jgi:hypothetical protein
LKPERPDGAGAARMPDLTVLGERLSICRLSTFDADYVLVREKQLDPAIDTLLASGHRVDGHAAGGR